MNRELIISTSKIEEMSWNLDESRAALEMAIQADSDLQTLGNVVCLVLRDLKRISDGLSEGIEQLKHLNGIGGGHGEDQEDD